MRARALMVVAAALVVTGAGQARTAATADLSVTWFGPSAATPAGTAFSLGASVNNDGPDPAHLRANIELPAGVQRIGGAMSCTEEGSVLHCDEFDAPVGDAGTGSISFLAASPGRYTFRVFLDRLSAADPDSSNNSDSITVTVVAAPTSAGRAAVAPARPRAGASFSVSFPVANASVSRVRCATSIGTAKPRWSAHRAACVVRTPRAARGRLVRVTVRATAGGHTFVRPVRVRLR